MIEEGLVNVNVLVEEGQDGFGTWFAKYHPDGSEEFSGRLGHDLETLEVAWSDHVALTSVHVRDIELTMGTRIRRIVGIASDLFEIWIQNGLLDSRRLLRRFDLVLGGRWDLRIQRHANRNRIDVEFILLGDGT